MTPRGEHDAVLAEIRARIEAIRAVLVDARRGAVDAQRRADEAQAELVRLERLERESRG